MLGSGHFVGQLGEIPLGKEPEVVGFPLGPRSVRAGMSLRLPRLEAPLGIVSRCAPHQDGLSLDRSANSLAIGPSPASLSRDIKLPGRLIVTLCS
jgi:hypothetical protein